MKLIEMTIISLLLLGCSNQPLTQAEALDRQVRLEQHVRSCQNAGGIWYGTVGLHGGYCDWTPRF